MSVPVRGLVAGLMGTHVLPSVLVETVYAFTQVSVSSRPCVTTPKTDLTVPRSICIHSSAVAVNDLHAKSESSIDCAFPVPRALSANTDEYVRLNSDGFWRLNAVTCGVSDRATSNSERPQEAKIMAEQHRIERDDKKRKYNCICILLLFAIEHD